MNKFGYFAVACGILAAAELGAEESGWKEHLIVQPGHCNTAVAIDANQDGLQDVVASYQGKVTLLIAPDWRRRVVLHRFATAGNCIHSAALDADGDGDRDWVGTLPNGHPFWLENPGPQEALTGAWARRTIDPVITGIHCILAADIDNDGRDDLVINNFLPDQGLADSIAWYRRPKNPHRAPQWPRHVFAQGDARGGSHYMGAGDIDGDGWKEIAVGAKGAPFEDGNWFAFWKNPGRSQIDQPWKKTVLATEQMGATNILPADVNGDGRVDWIASRGHGVGVLWLENPHWKPHTIDGDIACPHSLTAADFDQDGDIDAASCGYESESLRWYENDGKGRFTVHIIANGQQSYDLRSVDMDGDGDLDLLNAGRAANRVSWFENRLVK